VTLTFVDKFGNGRTNERTDGRTSWEHNAFSSQSGLLEVQET